MFISSLQNPRIKEIVQLRQGRKRRQSGKFLIDGRREVYRAFACGFPILEVFFAPDLTDEETFEWMKEFEDDPKQIWNSNIFGKSLHELVNEGLQTKLHKMPEDAQCKLQETLEKIINEGSGGLICIIL